MFLRTYFVDETEVRNFVVWLEDKKIRLYKIEERDALRDVESSSWVVALKKVCWTLLCYHFTEHYQMFIKKILFVFSI